MSIGTKFNLVALGIPVVALLALLGAVYYSASNLFQSFLVLAGGFLALDGVVWNRLRTQVETKTHNVWDHYLKRIRDSASTVGFGEGYYFPRKYEELDSKIDWVSKYAKYGPLELYPTKLVKEKLVTKMLRHGEDFNSKLDKILADSRGGDFELNIYYAFDHWGLRKMPADQPPHLAPLELTKQKLYLEGLDKNEKQEVTELIEAWREPFNLSKQIATTLDKFSSENGIMPPKPPSFGGIP
jgi:hypothetical protein